jgi:hypothetical protein
LKGLKMKKIVDVPDGFKISKIEFVPERIKDEN